MRKCASTKNCSPPRRAVFVFAAHIVESLQENARRYDGHASGGLLGGINTYAYVGSNPLSYADPAGLNPTAVWGAGVGSAFGPAGTAIGAVAGWAIGAWAGNKAANWIFNQPEVDPVPEQQPFNPGKDPCTGKCNPCPPPIFWDAAGNKHGSTSGSHAHGIVWNQTPDCWCHPKRVSGPSLGGKMK